MEIKETKYSGYYVTEDGRVFKELKQHNTNGYKAVNVHDGMRNRLERVHRLVVEAFFGLIPEGMVVNHKDGDKAHNHYTNLEIFSYKENNAHAKATGLNGNRGEKSHYARLTEAEVIAMYHAYKAGATGKELATKYKIGVPTVYAIMNGRRWKHVIDRLVEGSETIRKE